MGEMLRSAMVVAVIGGYLHVVTDGFTDVFAVLPKMIKLVVLYALAHLTWYFMDVHKRLGPWGVSEPKSHLVFALKSSWIVALFGLGNDFVEKLFHINAAKVAKFADFELSDSYHIFSSDNLGKDIAVAMVVFYTVDFLRYWSHRAGHWAFFYYTFPFCHGHHHNQLFINPMTTIMSPMLHFASLATYTPCLIAAICGNQRAALMAWGWIKIPNVLQHLGFDPLPWLTKINHYYCAGCLPWIPIYHMYHHNPFVKAGNFGNTTVLFDYIYGTLVDECVYHIENDKPPKWLAEKFADPEKLGKTLDSMYNVGRGKNRIDMNEAFDLSIFKTYTL